MRAAVATRLRAELRGSWLRWLGVALIIGIAAGAVIALAAGARRTDSSYARFLETQRGFDIVVINYAGDESAIYDFAELASLK
jgi:hypothetical protein